jgi:homoserine/homoserine lactone efflux protein
MFALFLGALLLVCVSPGPNVFLCISTGLQRGAMAVLQVVGGIVVASMIFLALSMAGIVGLLSRSPAVFAAVRVAGALYLIYLGVRMLWASREPLAFESRAQSGPHPLLQGFTTHISNPKAILFWTALLPQFIDPQQSLAPQTLRLGVVAIAVDAAILSSYGVVAAKLRHRFLSTAFASWLDRIAGGFFVLAGAWLLTQ